VRTDLPASQNYGDRKAMQEQIAGAPTARTADVRGLPTGQVQAAAQAAPQPPITELYAPTQRPDEPITSGVAVGPGPGPEVMGYAGQSEKLSDILSQMLPYDTDGEIAILYQQAVSRGL
ncbi:MAG: hypothetical protein EBU08_21780, partial [Micrococcales bacterium]|nr:hypothetical protein [Micrococcales bacterium]